MTTGAASVTPGAGARTFGVEADMTADGTEATVVSGRFIGGDGNAEPGRAAARAGRFNRNLALEVPRTRLVFARSAARETGAGLAFRVVLDPVRGAAAFLRGDRLVAGRDGGERRALFLGLAARGFFDFMPAKLPF
jgi:hypothetical protein